MKIVLKYTMILLMAISFVACTKDELTDLQPISSIPSDKAFLTLNDATNAVNGVYGTWLGRRPAYLSSFISDELRLGTVGYRNVGNILFNWQYVSDAQDWRDGENGGAWTNLYQVIDRANRALELMTPVPTANNSEAGLKVQYKGELIALRAMAHLELLRWYSKTIEYTPGELGVVLQTTYVKAPGSYRPPRSTQEEVITQVIEDLAEARNLIPSSFVDIGRVTKNAVIATQARVALHTKNWQGVVDRSTEVIPLQPISSIANYPALWNTRSLLPDQSTEVIWKLNVTISNLGAAIGSLWQDLGGAVQAQPSDKLVNTFDPANDVRYNTFFRTPLTTLPSPINLIAKYGAVIAGNGENFQYDIKMIRTSEILLSRAEAYAELDMLTEANNDLNTLRTNRITGYVHVPLLDKASLINEIMLERFKELCFEGHRYFDLKRRSLPIVRELVDVAGNASILQLNPTDAKYLLPIPQQEVAANPNVTQNPNY